MQGGLLHRALIGHARRTPDATALVTAHGRLGYRQLKEAVERLAARITDRLGAPRDAAPVAPVAICTDRLPDALVAMLAVLATGRPYTMLPSQLPVPEQRRLLGVAQAAAVLARRADLPRLDDGSGRPTILLDADGSTAPAGQDRTEPHDAVPLAGAATVLFTAGVTDRRRAVTLAEERWCAALDAWQTLYGLTPDDHVLVTAAVHTTAFTAAWLRAWCAGATLEAARVPADATAVTVADADPATAAGLLAGDALPALRLLTVSGEPLNLADHLRLQGLVTPGARVVSLYGTAETAGCGTWFEPDQLPGPRTHPGRSVFLGRPLPGCDAVPRKNTIWLTPPGGGRPSPTGDLGRWAEQGLLEYRGRAADVVKIGKRSVDTYPIESALRADPAIAAALVTGDRGRTGQRLIAFVVPARGAPAPDAGSVRAALTGLVPAADIPGTVVRLGKLPRNADGKVDRRALPLPAARTGSGGKGGGTDEPFGTEAALGCLVPALAAVLSFVLTHVFWPGSTDLTGVPGPWSTLFVLLYLLESLAFAAGVAVLLTARARMVARGGRNALTTAAHLSLVWLLASWWPQDNLYRLASKTDWPRQAALVYVFNVSLMIAAAVVAVWAARARPPDE